MQNEDIKNPYRSRDTNSWLSFLRDIHQKRRSDTDRRICPYHCTEEERECESFQTLWSEEEHRQKYDKYGRRSENRSTHGIVDSSIDDVRESHLLSSTISKVRSDTVHNHDCIIDRIPEYRQECRQEEGVDLKLWEEVRRRNIESECYYHIMYERYSCHYREWE